MHYSTFARQDVTLISGLFSCCPSGAHSDVEKFISNVTRAASHAAQDDRQFYLAYFRLRILAFPIERWVRLSPGWKSFR